MERAGGDEEDVVRADEAVTGLHRGPLDDRQQVALHPLARDVGPVGVLAGHHLVEFVDEDEAHVLGQLDGRRVNLVLVNHRVAFPFEEDHAGFGHRHLAPRAALGKDLLEHRLQVEVHLFHAHPGEHHGHGLLFGGQLDAALIHLAGGEHGAHFLAGALVALGRVGAALRRVERGRRRGQQVHEPVFHPTSRFLLDAGPLLLTDQPDGVLHQLANHALHVAAVIADLGVLGGLDLNERGPGQLGQASGDLRLAHPGRPNHEDVLGHHLGAHFLRDALPPPAVADGDGHRPFRIVLSHDVPI